MRQATVERRVEGWGTSRGQVFEMADAAIIVRVSRSGKWINIETGSSSGARSQWNSWGYNPSEKRWSYNRALPAKLLPIIQEMLNELQAQQQSAAPALC